MRAEHLLKLEHLADWTLAEVAARLLWLERRQRGVPALWYEGEKRAAHDAEVDYLKGEVERRRAFQTN